MKTAIQETLKHLNGDAPLASNTTILLKDLTKAADHINDLRLSAKTVDSMKAGIHDILRYLNPNATLPVNLNDVMGELVKVPNQAYQVLEAFCRARKRLQNPGPGKVAPPKPESGEHLRRQATKTLERSGLHQGRLQERTKIDSWICMQDRQIVGPREILPKLQIRRVP